MTIEIQEAHAKLTALGAPEGGTLAERIDDLGAELAATEDLNRKLMDPEFSFTNDRMQVVDAREIASIFVESFDEAIAKGGAQNFLMFEVHRGDQLAYTVTIQKATGQSVSEAFLAVSKKLQALEAAHCPDCAKARAEDQRDLGVDLATVGYPARCPAHDAPVLPPPEDTPSRPPGPTDHVKLDMRRARLWCAHCDREVPLPQPVEGTMLKAMQDAFLARHGRCRPPKDPSR